MIILSENLLNNVGIALVKILKQGCTHEANIFTTSAVFVFYLS